MNHQWREHTERAVVWADGTYDHSRVCDLCKSTTCSYPVHTDHYPEIGKTRLEIEESGDVFTDFEEEKENGYWEWMHLNQPLGGFFDHDGDLVTPEFKTANPDLLAELKLRASGIPEQVHMWMREAYELLTDAQKEAWNAVMREQISATELANRLGISEKNVRKRVDGAKVKIVDYLRNKQGYGFVH